MNTPKYFRGWKVEIISDNFGKRYIWKMVSDDLSENGQHPQAIIMSMLIRRLYDFLPDVLAFETWKTLREQKPIEFDIKKLRSLEKDFSDLQRQWKPYLEKLGRAADEQSYRTSIEFVNWLREQGSAVHFTDLGIMYYVTVSSHDEVTFSLIPF